MIAEMKTATTISIVFLLCLLGQSCSERKDFYLSKNFVSGIRIAADSIYVTSPYGISLASLPKGPLPKKLEFTDERYPMSVVTNADSAIIIVGKNSFPVYPIDHPKTEWDSITFKLLSRDVRRELLSKIVVENTHIVKISGLWNKTGKTSDTSEMVLKKNSFSAKLWEEFDWISPSTFNLLAFSESENFTGIELEKCINGDCISFAGTAMPANFYNATKFLNRPFNYIE